MPYSSLPTSSYTLEIRVIWTSISMSARVFIFKWEFGPILTRLWANTLLLSRAFSCLFGRNWNNKTKCRTKRTVYPQFYICFSYISLNMDYCMCGLLHIKTQCLDYESSVKMMMAKPDVLIERKMTGKYIVKY